MNKKCIQIILNITNFCNLACSYCYYDDVMQKKPREMDLDLLESVFKKISQSKYDDFHFSIHGGEPLATGIKYLETLIDLQAKYLIDKSYSNSIQTNGTLLNKNIIEFIRRTLDRGIKFKIGVSIDGSEEIQNSCRLHKNGTATFDTIIKNLEELDKYCIPYSALSVFNNATYENLPEVYPFFKALKGLTEMDFIIPHKFPGREPINPDRLAFTFNYIFDEWFEDNESQLNIRIFSDLVNKFSGKAGNHICCFSPVCINNINMISIDVDGMISPCDSLPHLQLGNIIDKDLDYFLNSNPLRVSAALQESNRRKSCLFCKWYRMCNGGCPVDFSDSDRCSSYCNELKKIFSHLENKLHVAVVDKSPTQL